MNKILLSALLLAAVFGLKAEVVFDFTDPVAWGFDMPANGAGVDIPSDQALTKDGVNVTFTKGSASNNPRFWGGTNGVDARVYKGSTIEVAATSGIASIEFTGADVKSMTVSVGTLAAGVWTGTATSVVFTMTGTVRIDAITVKGSADQPAVANPVLTPGANVYTEPVEVTMTCATAGATIKYALNDGNEQVYTSPITISTTTTVKAYAQKGADKSALIEAFYEIKSVAGFDNVAQFYTANKGDLVRFNCPVIVTYQNGSYLYVQDKDKNHMLIYAYDAPKYNPGDNIPAGIEGVVDVYQNVKQLKPTIATLKEATPGTVEPTVMTTDVMNNIAFVHKYVEVRNSTITASLLTDDKGSMTVYNKFKVEIPTDGAAYHNRGIVAAYNGALQYYPIEFLPATALENVKGNSSAVYGEQGLIRFISDTEAPVAIFNATGQVVKTTQTVAGESAVSVAQGLYIVKIGSKLHKVIVR